MPRPVPPQVIPRPAEWRLGGPPPWAAVGSERRASISLDQVLAAFGAAGQRGPVPEGAGLDAIFTPPPLLTERDGPPGELWPAQANAGVLVPLFEEDGQARIVLTRRSTELRTHQGQVSFPGGRLDAGEDTTAAARREAHEEVGLDPSLVTIVGWLHPLTTLVSSSLIQPVLATLAARPHLVPNPTEVERVFDVSLAELADLHVFHEERWRIPGRAIPGSEDDSFPVWFFEVSGEMIWGATARMLYELLGIVLGAR
ncbi:MAG TPA: CoA pyrophosphatase [Acidimicrobiales bacterium]|jgi:8-oxo-dGTP pyrophosphatase MutT (NUDIX family)|nr:CoA pyrophosphatase [Acidimicrobiales bacterium]